MPKNVSKYDEDQIIQYVNKILDEKKIDSNADISELEKQLNAIIYRLYNLSDEEIDYIESTIDNG